MTAQEHVDRFNAAVRSGDFTAFAATFHPDAVMTFVGPPVGPFVGREAIAAGYAAQPPTDTMTILSVRRDSGAEVVGFRWDHGGTGTMTIRRAADGLITALTVAFA